VVIQTPDAKTVYRVQSTKVVRPEDVRVLAETPVDTVTLVTCYPFHFIGSAPKRFIVRAVKVLMVQEARNAAPSRADAVTSSRASF
jgi:sortase A